MIIPTNSVIVLQLLKCLEKVTEGLFASTSEIGAKLSEAVGETERTQTKLHDAQNQLLFLASSQFIENVSKPVQYQNYARDSNKRKTLLI